MLSAISSEGARPAINPDVVEEEEEDDVGDAATATAAAEEEEDEDEDDDDDEGEDENGDEKEEDDNDEDNNVGIVVAIVAGIALELVKIAALAAGGPLSLGLCLDGSDAALLLLLSELATASELRFACT
jgi:hypothetical protein